jgi:hypothetical protein
MTAKISKQGNIEILTIEMPISVRPSNSGKTTVIASTNGNILADIVYNGKPVTIGVNAYYK